MTGINDLLKKANDILDNTKDPKLQLQTINVLANLYAGILTMASDGNIIQQAMEKVELLEDIKRGKFEGSNEEPVTDEDADITETEDDSPTEAEEDLKEEE
jgi:hypothetical protein